MEASVSRERTGIANRISNWVANSPLRRYPDLGLICLGVFIMLIGVGAIVPVRAIYARDRAVRRKKRFPEHERRAGAGQ